MPKEQLQAEVAIPQLPQRRIGVVEKAASLLNSTAESLNPSSATPLIQSDAVQETADSTPSDIKVTFRLLPDQVEWLKQKVKEHQRKYPRAPRLTTQEVIRLLVDHAKTLDFDKIVARHRSQTLE
jgi:hypothetical protein